MSKAKAKRLPVVRVRCVGCKAEREIGPYEVEPGDTPMCSKCYNVMVPVSARSK